MSQLESQVSQLFKFLALCVCVCVLCWLTRTNWTKFGYRTRWRRCIWVVFSEICMSVINRETHLEPFLLELEDGRLKGSHRHWLSQSMGVDSLQQWEWERERAIVVDWVIRAFLNGRFNVTRCRWRKKGSECGVCDLDDLQFDDWVTIEAWGQSDNCVLFLINISWMCTCRFRYCKCQGHRSVQVLEQLQCAMLESR